jgi:hypothetical protein
MAMAVTLAQVGELVGDDRGIFVDVLGGEKQAQIDAHHPAGCCKSVHRGAVD